jgi:hypothetical protein
MRLKMAMPNDNVAQTSRGPSETITIPAIKKPTKYAKSKRYDELLDAT